MEGRNIGWGIGAVWLFLIFLALAEIAMVLNDIRDNGLKIELVKPPALHMKAPE